MPKFNLNWMYMIIALMLLGLWWGSDSRGAGNKAVTYSEFQDYVKNGYVSKVLGYEDKSIEAYLKPNSVGAVFGADSTKVGRNPIITSRAPSTDKLEEFLQAEKEAGHFDGTSDYPPKSDIFPAILIQVLPLVLLIALWIFFMRRMSGGGSGGPGGVFNVGKSKAQLFGKGGAIKITFKDVAGLAEAKQEAGETNIYRADREQAILEKLSQGVPEDRLPEYLAVVRKIMETSRMYQYGMLFDWNPQLFAQLAKDIDIHSGGTRVVVRLTRPDQPNAMSSILNMVGDYGYNMQYMELLHFNKPEKTVTFDLTILGDLSETNMQKLMFQLSKESQDFRILKNE